MRKSEIILILRWDLDIFFLLVQVMKQRDPIYAQEFGEHWLEVNPSIKGFALWSKAPRNNNPIVLY